MRRPTPLSLLLLLFLAVGCSSVDSGKAAQDLTTVATPHVEPLIPPTVDASYGVPAYRWPGQAAGLTRAADAPAPAQATVFPAPLSAEHSTAVETSETPSLTNPPAPKSGFLSEQLSEEAGKAKVAEVAPAQPSTPPPPPPPSK